MFTVLKTSFFMDNSNFLSGKGFLVSKVRENWNFRTSLAFMGFVGGNVMNPQWQNSGVFSPRLFAHFSHCTPGFRKTKFLSIGGRFSDSWLLFKLDTQSATARRLISKNVPIHRRKLCFRKISIHAIQMRPESSKRLFGAPAFKNRSSLGSFACFWGQVDGQKQAQSPKYSYF